jgi:hypothetical protein
MDDIIGALAFAILMAAQVCAVVAVHGFDFEGNLRNY